MHAVERIFDAGSEFTDFDVIGTDLYSTLRTEYEERDFERLKELMWFNVITNTEVILRFRTSPLSPAGLVCIYKTTASGLFYVLKLYNALNKRKNIYL